MTATIHIRPGRILQYRTYVPTYVYIHGPHMYVSYVLVHKQTQKSHVRPQLPSGDRNDTISLVWSTALQPTTAFAQVRP
jgi:hypothetical protein